MTFAYDVVHQVLGGGRQHQSRDTVDYHQSESESEEAATRMNELQDFRKRLEDRRLGGRLRRFAIHAGDIFFFRWAWQVEFDSGRGRLAATAQTPFDDGCGIRLNPRSTI